MKPFSDDMPVIDQFHEFIQSASCPVSLKIPYERMHHRHLEKLTNQEPVAGDINESTTCGIDEDIIEMLQIAATFNVQNSDDLSGTYTFEKGASYEWDRDPSPVRNQIFFNNPFKSTKQCFSMDRCIQDSLSSFIEISQTRLSMDLYCCIHRGRQKMGKLGWLNILKEKNYIPQLIDH
jgi:hypothetical protein